MRDVPTKYQRFSKMPIILEAMSLEKELEKELDKTDGSEYSADINFLFRRCNTLWKKIYSKSLNPRPPKQ